jgi:hypothetical protein
MMLHGPAVSALRRAFAEVKQRWSVIGWVTKNLLYRVPPCFGTNPHGDSPHWARSPYVSSIRKGCAPAVGALTG